MYQTTRIADALERLCVGLALMIVLMGGTICLQPECFPTPYQRQVKKILAALELRQPKSRDLVRELIQQPDSGPFGIALAAEAAAIGFEHDEAIRFYQQLPQDGGKWEFLSAIGIARRSEVLGRLTQEEHSLRRALEISPWDLEANTRLSHILQIAGRTWEAIPSFLIQIQQGKCRGDELLGLAAPERFFRNDDHLDELGLAIDPPDLMIQLAMARRDLYENRHVAAEKRLREICEMAPQLGEAQGRLGRIVYDRGDYDEFFHWRGALPQGAMNHPDVWFVQGLHARRTGQIEGATRCFLETLALSPNHLPANVQIAGCLDQLKYHDLAKEFVHRAEILANLEAQLNMLRKDVDPELIKRVIASCADLGRFWEAAGWTYVMTHLPKLPQASLRKELRHWLALGKQHPHQTSAQFHPERKLKRSDFSEPNWKSVAFAATSGAARGTTGAMTGAMTETTSESGRPNPITWSFTDDAERVGISFEYHEGTTEETRLQHIFNVVGGGVACVDYDLDGWCDLYLAQANNWRDPTIQPEQTDRLYHNQGGKFFDVSALAGLGDTGFSHGVTVGDFDQDGFPDIHVGNLGPNRLYHNQGDGTFVDVTLTAGVAGQEWTTSSLFADLSGDGLPDLYVANYSQLEQTAKKECHKASGEPMACTPDVLTAEYHRLYLNSGDGTFRDITVESGMHLPNGRGLGLIAWKFGEDERLGLFVANDTSPNFLLINTGTNAEGVPQFREEGAVRGVAFDADGNAQACMGIAASDANGDGRIDLYITNFFGESDTLYSQRADGFFEDATRTFALRDAGFWTLGFGCQFADLDGDGWEDLISTNGHVDQQSSRGDADRMPPQVFRNRQGKRFDEIPGDHLGPFFQRGYLGRGLATLDWNRDGITDLAISHLHSPFALLTNSTKPAGQPLVIKLIGRTGVREPTGAIVKIQSKKTTQFRLMTAGDGYLSTNERRLVFFIPTGATAEQVEVRWPNGKTQIWYNLGANQEILLIEGEESPLIIHPFP